MSRFLLIRFVLPLLLVCAGAGAWWGVGPRKVAVDSSAERLLASDPRNLETVEKLDALIPDTEMVLVALRMDGIFSDRGAHILARTSELLRRVEGCRDVKSLTHSGRPVRKGLRLAVEPFIPLRADPDTWEEIREFTTSFPLSRNVLVSEDARYAILVGVYDRALPDHAARLRFRDEIDRALSEARSVVESVHVLAFPFLEAAGVEAVTRDIRTYGAWAAGLILVVLLVTFRNPAAVVAVLLWEGLGMAILLGVFRILGQSVDVYTGILFPLIGGLQLTFVTHYLSAWQRFAGRESPARAAVSAFREVLPPSALAALTTMAGLATLMFADLPTLNAFGRVGVVAVAGVFAGTFALPAVYGWRRDRAERHAADPEPAARGFPRGLAIGGLAGLAVALATAAPWIPRIRTDIRAVEFIRPGHPIRESIELLNQELGGTNIFQVRVDSGRRRGLQSREMLEYLEDIRRFAAGLEGITDAYAYSQLYMGLNQIWEGGDRARATLPESAAKLALFSQVLNNTPLLFQESFVDGDARTSLMILRSRDMPAREYLEVLERFLREARARAPEGVVLTPVKGLHTLLEGDRRIVENQVRTLAWSAGAVALLLGVLWRSVRLALAVLIANLPALAVIFGGMGWTGFPLNSITVMVAAVILGIAVDDGIHLVGAVRRHLRDGRIPARAVGAALREKWRPMACTSAILSVFLGLLLLTSFPPVAHFGILGAGGIAAAFMGAVWILPSLLVFMIRAE